MRIPGFGGQPPVAVLRRAARGFFHDDMPIFAAALSYHALLALFPFLIFLLTLLGALGLEEFFAWLLHEARASLPREAFQVVALVIGEVKGHRRVALLSFSILFAILAASTGVRSLMRSLAAAYGVAGHRPVWQSFLLSVLYTIGLAVLLTTAAGFVLLGPRTSQLVAGHIGLTAAAATFWIWLRWPFVVALLLLTVAIIYYLGPSVAQPFRLVTPGSLIAVVVWGLTSFGLAWYVANFGSFGATYGSLGGVIVLLIYFYALAAVLLFGAEVNATILELSHADTDATCPPA